MKYVREMEHPFGVDRAIRLLDAEVSPTQEYIDELHKLLGHMKWSSDRDGSVSFGVASEYGTAEAGDWIIVHHSGMVTSMNHEDFSEEYGAV